MTTTHEQTYATGSPAQAPDAVPPGILTGIVEALARALELHDYRRGSFGETNAHIERVTRLACRLAERVAPELAADPQLAAAFRLHDIGMIGIPIQVLSKQGPLTLDEVNEIREHPWLGERIVAPIADLNGLVRQVIAAHHEQWDGSGYPHGVRGTEIPLGARIFSVADAYEAMTNAQPYRDPLPPEAALAQIQAGSGTQFDPAVVDAFIPLLSDLADEAARAALADPADS